MGLMFKYNDMIPIIKYNELDEFGARYQLQRYHNDDYTYQLKLLDIFIHKPNSSYEGLLYDLIRRADLYRAKVGFVKYRNTTVNEDKITYRFEITDTHIKIYDVLSKRYISETPLYYTTPSVLKRNEQYYKYDIVFYPGSQEYILECIIPGTTDTNPISLPNTININDTIVDGSVTWIIKKLSEPRLLNDVVDQFNSYNNWFEIVLYSHLSNSYIDLYAPYILPTTNYKLIENKPLFPGENKLDALIEINSEYFNTPNYYIKKTDSSVLYENEYTIDYINGVLKIGNINSQENINYILHKESIDLIYSPVKLFTLNNDAINVFMVPMYINKEIVKELDLQTNNEESIAYNYYTPKLYSLDKEQQDRFQILWDRDQYVYDLLSFNDTDFQITKCEVIPNE